MGVFDDLQPTDVNTSGTAPLDGSDMSTGQPFDFVTVNPGTNFSNSGFSMGAGDFAGPVPGGSLSRNFGFFGIGQFEDLEGDTQFGMGFDAHVDRSKSDGAALSVNDIVNTMFTGPSIYDDWHVPLVGDIPVGLESSTWGVSGGVTISDETVAMGGGAEAGAVGATLGNDEHSLRVSGSVGPSLAGRVHYGDEDGDGVREMGLGADLGPVGFDVKSECLGQLYNAVGGQTVDTKAQAYLDWITSIDLW